MKRAVVIGLAFAIALVIVEALLQNVGGVFHDDLTQLDSVRGWTLRPNAAGWMRDENTLWVEINSDGLRDRDHALAAAPATIRVAVLGDSYMQGLNVPIEKTFSTFLERELAACRRLTGAVETINFAVTGYGTAQELLTYRHHARRYRPDVVLVAFYTNNDVYNNHRALNPSVTPELTPYFVLRNGDLELDRAFEQEVLAHRPNPHERWWRRGRIFLTDRFRVAQLAYGAWAAWRTRESQEEEDEEPVEDAPIFDRLNIYRVPQSAEEIEAWAVTEALLAQLATEVRRDGAEPWIVTLTNADQVHPDIQRRNTLAASLGVDTLFYPDRRIAAFGAANGIPVISLAESLAERSAAERLVLHGGYNDAAPAGDGHWNETANALAARMVADRLCTESRAIAGNR